MPKRTRKSILRSGTCPCVTLGILLLCISVAAYAEWPLPQASYLLGDFESETTFEDWHLRNVMGEIIKERATHGRASARLTYRRCAETMEMWPAAILSHGRGAFTVADWTDYDYLRLDLFNESDATAPVMMHFVEQETEQGKGSPAIGPWSLGGVPPKRPHTYRVSLANLAKHIDISRMGQIHIYVAEPGRDYTVCLDNLRLERVPLHVEELRIDNDLATTGWVSVWVKLDRHAKSTLQVVDADGDVVASVGHDNRWLVWRWDGAVNDQQLAPGRYTILLTAVDETRGETLKRALGPIDVKEGARPMPRAILWYAPSTQKVMLHDRPDDAEPVMTWDKLTSADASVPPLHIDIVRNEYEAAQVVLLVRGAPLTWSAAIENLRHERTNESFTLADSAVWQVGYVKTDDPRVYPVDYAGWWPDPLLPTKSMIAEPDQCTPMWISLKSAKDTTPGLYRGRVVLQTDRGETAAFPLHVRVHDVTLPDTTTVKTAFSYHPFLPGSTNDLHGGSTPEPIRKKYMQFIADHRLNPASIYRQDFPNVIEMRDFANRGQLNAFNVWSLGRSTDEQIQEHFKRFDPYIDFMRRQGNLADKAYFYGFDEKLYWNFAKERIKETFSAMKQRYPDIKTATTARDPSRGLKTGLDVVDIWCPILNAADPAVND